MALVRRVRLLETLVCLLEDIKTQIRFKNAGLFEIIETLKQYGCYQHIKFLFGLEHSVDFQKTWAQCVERSIQNGEIGKEDGEILYSFGSQLGQSDVAGQLAHCDIHIELLKKRLGDAKAKKDSHSKLYISLGLLVGLGAGLLLI